MLMSKLGEQLDRITRLQDKYEISAATELSSRPERSGVERSAVSLEAHTRPKATLKPALSVFEGRSLRGLAQSEPEGDGGNR
jgi:hypothetical protein